MDRDKVFPMQNEQLDAIDYINKNSVIDNLNIILPNLIETEATITNISATDKFQKRKIHSSPVKRQRRFSHQDSAPNTFLTNRDVGILITYLII